jgi:hypothetical protein
MGLRAAETERGVKERVHCEWVTGYERLDGAGDEAPTDGSDGSAELVAIAFSRAMVGMASMGDMGDVISERGKMNDDEGRAHDEGVGLDNEGEADMWDNGGSSAWDNGGS